MTDKYRAATTLEARRDIRRQAEGGLKHALTLMGNGGSFLEMVKTFLLEETMTAAILVSANEIADAGSVSREQTVHHWMDYFNDSRYETEDAEDYVTEAYRERIAGDMREYLEELDSNFDEDEDW